MLPLTFSISSIFPTAERVLELAALILREVPVAAELEVVGAAFAVVLGFLAHPRALGFGRLPAWPHLRRPTVEVWLVAVGAFANVRRNEVATRERRERTGAFPARIRQRRRQRRINRREILDAYLRIRFFGLFRFRLLLSTSTFLKQLID